MRIVHFFGLVVAVIILAVMHGIAFMFHGRKAFDAVDDWLEKHDLADISRTE